jgi:hypothetical protein
MKKQTTSFMQKFERLYKEAVEDDNLFGDQGEDIIDDYENDIDEIEDTEEGSEEVTVTLTVDQVEVLRDILSQVEGEEEEDEEDEEDFDAFGDEDVSDIEELEEEAVETQSAPDAESVRSKTKSGKASTKTGDLDYDSQTKDGEEKQYKFVKREKPTELKYKTTKGS